jgi:hypothetical protein
MKTAMQELYDLLESYRLVTNTISIVDVQRMVGIYYNGKEKEQIIEAYDEGRDYGFATNGNEYYEETFN